MSSAQGDAGESPSRERCAGWHPDPATLTHWNELTPGRTVMVAKLAPNGHETTRYSGTVVRQEEPEQWVEIEARWTNRPVAVGGLRFEPGAILREAFSPHLPFNAFTVFDPSGNLRGWYANVTYPAKLDADQEPPLLVWHDLYLDVVAFPDGSFMLLDEDELADSGLAVRDPSLHSCIVDATGDILLRFQEGRPPFRRNREQESEAQ